MAGIAVSRSASDLSLATSTLNTAEVPQSHLAPK